MQTLLKLYNDWYSHLATSTYQIHKHTDEMLNAQDKTGHSFIWLKKSIITLILVRRMSVANLNQGSWLCLCRLQWIFSLLILKLSLHLLCSSLAYLVIDWNRDFNEHLMMAVNIYFNSFLIFLFTHKLYFTFKCYLVCWIGFSSSQFINIW